MPLHPQYESYLTNGAGTISGTVTLRSFNSNRKSILIQNIGGGTLFIGGPEITVTNSLQIAPNSNINLTSAGGAAIYAASEGTTIIRFLEEVS